MLTEWSLRTMRPRGSFIYEAWAEPSLDVHGIEGGSPHLMKTIVPAQADANLCSFGSFQGRRSAPVAVTLEALLRGPVSAGSVGSTRTAGRVRGRARITRFSSDPARDRCISARCWRRTATREDRGFAASCTSTHSKRHPGGDYGIRPS